MGLDCSLYDGKEFHYLDRWYVFSNEFISTLEYSKKNSLNLLKKLRKDIFSISEYNQKRIKEAIRIIKKSKSKSFRFFTDNDYPDAYFDLPDECFNL